MLLESLVDLRSLNLINFLFVQLIVVIVLLGSLIATVERYLPSAISQTFRYGKHAYKGPQDWLVSLLEVPKSWFKHFYVFAALWSTLGFYYVANTYFAGRETPGYVIDFLDIMATNKRSVKTTPTETMVAMLLITIQCWRRFYETWFIQVFSSKMKMNLSAYLVGYMHYFGTVVVILSQAEGFVRADGSPLPYRFELSPWIALYIMLFVLAWRGQFQSNMILANLRKNRNGEVVHHNHSIPKGGYFELISSPHMFFEIMMYAVLCILIDRNTSKIYVLLWVVSNQVMNAWLTHQWYLENFKDYPRTRRAVFPYIL